MSAAKSADDIVSEIEALVSAVGALDEEQRQDLRAQMVEVDKTMQRLKHTINLVRSSVEACPSTKGKTRRH